MQRKIIVPCRKFRSPYLITWVRHTSHKSSGTHLYHYHCISVVIFPCVQTMVIWYGCQCMGLLIYAVLMPHCLCLYMGSGVVLTLKRSWLGGKFLATMETQTCISIAPSFSVGHSTNWVIPTPVKDLSPDWDLWQFIGLFCLQLILQTVEFVCNCVKYTVLNNVCFAQIWIVHLLAQHQIKIHSILNYY